MRMKKSCVNAQTSLFARIVAALSLPTADERIDPGDGLIAWRWGQGPVVLLVHGFEGNRAQFASFVEALVELGFTAVALDVPTYGESAMR